MRKTPICSILIPSRNRPQALQAAIDSFLATAADPSQVEIIVRVHDDDEATLEWAKNRAKGIRVIVGDTDDGYGSLSEFVNCMAAVSKGDWIWPAADDDRVRTQGWDRILAQRLTDPRHTCLLLDSSVEGSRLCLMSRGWYRAIGYYGMTEHGDTYAHNLARTAGMQETVAIDFPNLHMRVVAARDRPRTWAEFRGEEIARCFNMDKLKLGAVLGRPITDTWTTSMAPPEITYDPTS